jgi:hypothetical protein
MHAGDTHKQKTAKNKTRLNENRAPNGATKYSSQQAEIKDLVKQKWPKAKCIVVLPFTDNFPVVRVFFKTTTIPLPVMKNKPEFVFEYKSAYYYLTSIQEPASLLYHKKITRGLTQLTLTPRSY